MKADPYIGHARGICVHCGLKIINGIQHRKYCRPKKTTERDQVMDIRKHKVLADLHGAMGMVEELGCSVPLTDLSVKLGEIADDVEKLVDASVSRTAWLIELADNAHEGCTTGEPLGIVRQAGEGIVSFASLWLDEHDWENALQFARKEDAELVAGELVPGMDVCIVEHSWG